ncbi:MAG: hypothetical protein NVV74_10970 [Magnetospirillum sp.]|nr:hypothetical protein [Magnetospirillum sp.]
MARLGAVLAEYVAAAAQAGMIEGGAHQAPVQAAGDVGQHALHVGAG